MNSIPDHLAAASSGSIPEQEDAAVERIRQLERALVLVSVTAKGAIRDQSRDIDDWKDDMDFIVRFADMALNPLRTTAPNSRDQPQDAAKTK